MDSHPGQSGTSLEPKNLSRWENTWSPIPDSNLGPSNLIQIQLIKRNRTKKSREDYHQVMTSFSPALEIPQQIPRD